MATSAQITADTKVADLLRDYPDLEEVLIGMAPPFKKLRNPILRRSVAKVASLRQAAAVGRIPVEQMLNDLRAAAGLELTSSEPDEADSDYFSARPPWFDQSRIVASLDEAEVDENVMPLRPLLLAATKMSEGEILELVTDYLPAPGIDVMKRKGFAVWAIEDGRRVKTYFSRITDG